MFNGYKFFFYVRIFSAYVLCIKRFHASLKFQKALLLKLNILQGVVSHRYVNLINFFK